MLCWRSTREGRLTEWAVPSGAWGMRSMSHRSVRKVVPATIVPPSSLPVPLPWVAGRFRRAAGGRGA